MAIKRLPSTGDSPRSTGVPASLVPGGAADSAGFPWAGRTFDHHETAFSGDDGATPPEFVQRLQALREIAAALVDGNATISALAQVHTDAMLTLSGCRVLVPLLAEAGDLGLTPEGRVVEKTQELSIVTVAGPDGRRVMPVFTSIETMRTWNPEARPIPVPMPQAAVAAAQEHTDLIIVNPGTPELELGVRRTQLEDVALARPVSLAWNDTRVEAAFQTSVESEARIHRLVVVPADPNARLLAPEIDVVLEVQPGLSETELNATLLPLQTSWASDRTIAELVDSLRIRII